MELELPMCVALGMNRWIGLVCGLVEQASLQVDNGTVLVHKFSYSIISEQY